jgi:hypothetical protein
MVEGFLSVKDVVKNRIARNEPVSAVVYQLLRTIHNTGVRKEAANMCLRLLTQFVALTDVHLWTGTRWCPDLFTDHGLHILTRFGLQTNGDLSVDEGGNELSLLSGQVLATRHGLSMLEEGHLRLRCGHTYVCIDNKFILLRGYLHILASHWGLEALRRKLLCLTGDGIMYKTDGTGEAVPIDFFTLRLICSAWGVGASVRLAGTGNMLLALDGQAIDARYVRMLSSQPGSDALGKGYVDIDHAYNGMICAKDGSPIPPSILGMFLTRTGLDAMDMLAATRDISSCQKEVFESIRTGRLRVGNPRPRLRPRPDDELLTSYGLYAIHKCGRGCVTRWSEYMY